MATIKVFTSNGQRGVMAELAPRFERATGHRIEASYDPGQIMMRRIATGETADVVILGGSALDDLAKQGKLVADTRRALSSCGIGLAVAAHVPKPDISTVDAFKRAILAAKSVAYTIEGASGIHFSGLIEKLGIAREVKAKEVRQPGGLVGELIAAGKAELAIQQIPELMAVAGIVYVGPLPADLQKTTSTSGAVFGASPNQQAARALLDFLSAPESKLVVRKMGHEPA